jgi:putative hydrolase of the HAD superfamily
VTRFDAVLFDLDGTLCRRTQDTDAVFAAAFDRAGTAPFAEPDDLWAALDGPPDPDDRVGYLGAGFARLAAQHDRDVDPLTLAEAFVAGVDDTQVELTPGAERALDAAAATGSTALLTNGPTDRQAAKVDALGLAERVDAVVYAGDHPRRKPHAAPFERTLAALDVPAARALYVGDSLAYDVAGAHTAGLAAAWLADDGADPAPYTPEFVLDSLADLPEVLA